MASPGPVIIKTSAEQISNQALRERFLQNVTVNQQIEAAWHSRQKQDN